MYAVVGCSRCDALWVLSGEPETTECRRCGRRHRVERLKRFVETDDEDAARQARAAMLADRADRGEAFADLDDFATMGERLEEAGVADEEYLAGSGVDPEAVAAAGERAAESPHGGGPDRATVVRAAIERQDAPDRAAVVAYAADRGVPAEAARAVLERLREAGEVAERDGTLRLL